MSPPTLISWAGGSSYTLSEVWASWWLGGRPGCAPGSLGLWEHLFDAAIQFFACLFQVGVVCCFLCVFLQQFVTHCVFLLSVAFFLPFHSAASTPAYCGAQLAFAVFHAQTLRA